jgi:predicted metalloprotease
LRIATKFKVNPGFAFYDDHRTPNAFATPRTVLPDSRGTVLMGMRLFGQCMSNHHDDGMTVIAICAHEFGHLHQMQSDYNARLTRLDKTVKPVELHADFLAGYFLAGRKEEHPDLDLHTVGANFDRMGDTDFNSPQHHGTAQERIAAITAGYRFGRSGEHDIDEAARAGVELVARMV